MDMVVHLLLKMKKKSVDQRFMGLMTWFWWRIELSGKLGFERLFGVNW
jgi:hypothetical protein